MQKEKLVMKKIPEKHVLVLLNNPVTVEWILSPLEKRSLRTFCQYIKAKCYELTANTCKHTCITDYILVVLYQ